MEGGVIGRMEFLNEFVEGGLLGVLILDVI